jgi:hypothetical protein
MQRTFRINGLALLPLCICLLLSKASAQTEIDGIMMTKNNFCTGLMYSHSSWKDYWEGTFKRDNENLGTVSTNMIGFMGNYGITDKLNALFSIPYVQTKATHGTLKGMKGIQDLSLTIKWMPVEFKIGKGDFSIYGIGGVSFPVTNYVADFLPMSIGLHSTNLSLRGLVDYQLGKFFVTASGTYVKRSNVTIDRTSYYTTEMHYTSDVDMPDATSFNFRIGYRSASLIAEAVVDNWTTLGGFDIRKNDMPFASNEMNATKAGLNLKYTVYKLPGLSLIAGGNYTISGRNVGQSTTLYGGAFYVLDFAKKKKPSDINQK